MYLHFILPVCVVLNMLQARKELAVSLFQTAVLLLFNDTPSLSFKDIQMSVNLGMLTKHSALNLHFVQKPES